VTDLSYDALTAGLQNERVLLVGGAGFIGHNLALELARLGAKVTIADNLGLNNVVANVTDTTIEPRRRQLYLNFLLDRFELLREAGVTMRNVDARLGIDLAEVFDDLQPTKVVHLAAISSAVAARKEPGLAFDLQLITLRNTIELCRLNLDRWDLELLFMSSSTVYGDFETASVDESTRPRPHGIYANAKYMGERLVRNYSQYGLRSTIVRPSALYGERCVSRRVSQVFIENALLGKPLLLEGGGDGRLDFTHIADLVQGLVRALAIPKPADYRRTFNLTYGDARTIAELAAIVRDVVPEVVLEDRPRAEEKPVRGTLETTLAREFLGFDPQYPLDKGYRDYCEWYVAQWERAKAIR
jgi:nucleoside-diphosphate-sugar epimerase